MNSFQRSILSGKFISAGSTKTGRVHVVQSKDGWSVKKEGVKRAAAVKESKVDAVNFAKSIASSGEIVIHKNDGSVLRTIKQ